MSIIIFIFILGVLVFIHELGHFLFAKLVKVRVDEFGFGYPPRALKVGTWRGTEITLNWIPFGGFVKLFGELGEEGTVSEEDKKYSLVHKPRFQQFLVMVGGIVFNIILGWILLSASYMIGMQTPVASAPEGYVFVQTELTVTHVLGGTPADEAGLEAGDIIKEYGSDDQVVTVQDETLTEFSSFINAAGEQGNDVFVVVLRGDDLEALEITPKEGVVANAYGIGAGVDRVGEMKLPFFKALVLGFNNTGYFIATISTSFIDLVSGKVPFEAVSGPVGIVGQVGDASKIGISYLIGFAALLSLNLAVLNAFPFPALDGGRILIIAIESLIGKRLPSTALQWINGIGFLLLIGLMVVITIKDIIQLF